MAFIKEAIEIRKKLKTEEYGQPNYISNPGDVLATLQNNEQFMIPKGFYIEMVKVGLAPAVHEITKENE